MNSIEVTVKRTLNVLVDIDEVIESINELPLASRWNIISKILNEVPVDQLGLTPERHEIVKIYLRNKLTYFESGPVKF